MISLFLQCLIFLNVCLVIIAIWNIYDQEKIRKYMEECRQRQVEFNIKNKLKNSINEISRL